MARGKSMQKSPTAETKAVQENNETNMNMNTPDTNVNTAPQQPKQTAVSYKPDDLILCRSMFAGTLLFSGIKSKMVYEFACLGDTQWIEYQDLRAAMMTGAKSIMAPYIVIEDEDLLEDIHWKKVKDLYVDMYSTEDLEDILELPTRDFKEKFEQLPIGFKKTIATTVSTRLIEGTFDSVNKVKIVDEYCGTDLKTLIG